MLFKRRTKSCEANIDAFVLDQATTPSFPAGPSTLAVDCATARPITLGNILENDSARRTTRRGVDYRRAYTLDFTIRVANHFRNPDRLTRDELAFIYAVPLSLISKWCQASDKLEPTQRERRSAAKCISSKRQKGQFPNEEGLVLNWFVQQRVREGALAKTIENQNMRRLC